MIIVINTQNWPCQSEGQLGVLFSYKLNDLSVAVLIDKVDRIIDPQCLDYILGLKCPFYL